MLQCKIWPRWCTELMEALVTWIVGGNCFNGFVCVADIQATFEFKIQRPVEYYNCVQKIHKIFDNLCVAFSGDIRSGLLIIEDLSIQVPQSMKENEYFDIDGQSSLLIEYLQNLYRKINPKESPYLELMFLWVAQEGEEYQFRPFCMKFKSPEFRLNSTPQIGASQSGAGAYNETYNSIFSFLSGRTTDNENYRKLFGRIEEVPHIWTVQKFKNLLFHEASAVNFPGVSKSLISFESVIAYKDIYPDWISPVMTDAFAELGVEYGNKSTANHNFNYAELDFSKINKKMAYLQENHPERFEAIRVVLSVAEELKDMESICKLPEIASDQYVDDEEIIHSQKLIAKWSDMVTFMRGKNIKPYACNAIA